MEDEANCHSPRPPRTHSVKVFWCYLAVRIRVCPLNHLCQLRLRHCLPQLLCDALQVADRDAPLLFHVKEVKDFEDVGARVLVGLQQSGQGEWKWGGRKGGRKEG